MAIAGAGVLGFAGPASAVDGPTVEFTDACGAVGLHIVGAADQEVTFKRNGEVFARFTYPSADGSSLVGVQANGDVLSVQFGEGTPVTHTYAKPEGCTLKAPVNFTLEPGCSGLFLLHINNTGSAPADGYRLKLDSGELEELDPIAPGATTLTGFADKVEVFGALGDSAVLWLLLDRDEPKGCGPETVTATFVDTCTGVTVTVKSTIATPQPYVVVKNPDTAETIFDGGAVTKDVPGVHEVPAATGDEVAVYYLQPSAIDVPEVRGLLKGIKKLGKRASEVPGFKLIGAHTYAKPATCGGTGGGLPVTGFQASLAAGIGLLLVGGGAALFVVSRRRVRFTADQ
jgi:LPXTG-motif cell wall-anchored protein